MSLRIEITSNSQLKFTLLTAFCKVKIELNSTKIFTFESEYTILNLVNVSNIGTNQINYFDFFC